MKNNNAIIKSVIITFFFLLHMLSANIFKDGLGCVEVDTVNELVEYLSLNDRAIKNLRFKNICKKIDNGDAKLVAQALKKNISLESLSFRFAGMGFRQVRIIAAALLADGNKTLKEIDLSGNKVRMGGAKIISAVLKSNKTLEKLILDNTDIGDKAALLLVGALKENTIIVDLSLNKNFIRPEILKKINEYLDRNRRINKKRDIILESIRNEEIILFLPKSYNCCNVGHIEIDNVKLKINNFLTGRRLGFGSKETELFFEFLINNYGNEKILEYEMKYNSNKFKTKKEIKKCEKYCESKKKDFEFIEEFIEWINTGKICDVVINERISNVLCDFGDLNKVNFNSFDSSDINSDSSDSDSTEPTEISSENNYVDKEEFVFTESFTDLLEKLYQDEESKDFKIKHWDGDIFVHSFILDLKTRLFKEFKSAAKGGFIIDNKNTILPYCGDASLEALKILIKFLYMDKIEIEEGLPGKIKKRLLLDLWDLGKFFMLESAYFEELNRLTNWKMIFFFNKYYAGLDIVDEFEFNCKEDFSCVNNDDNINESDCKDICSTVGEFDKKLEYKKLKKFINEFEFNCKEDFSCVNHDDDINEHDCKDICSTIEEFDKKLEYEKLKKFINEFEFNCKEDFSCVNNDDDINEHDCKDICSTVEEFDKKLEYEKLNDKNIWQKYFDEERDDDGCGCCEIF